ncbi:MAG: addiction module protein [SAR324 cluster bacterium]|nr:addiction module protein [SAR324 cluster bacterium]
MSTIKEEIYTKALNLSPIERAELIENLITSFDFPSRKSIDELWGKEAESRIDAFERGEIEAVSARDVFEKIENRKNS